jgi:ABC-type glutathione transport system ATPase component
MLGLSRREVRKRFDQIVDFSGLEQFIDVPVKNYSSGMYVRLAFSVAAHLNPEIVILDEVLAVGDAIFQKKCFDRMEEIINEGHAAILVSHGMGNVRRMSQVCMWLRHGRIEMFGPTHEVVSHYEKQTTHEVVSQYEKKTQQTQSKESAPIARLLSWSVESNLSTDIHTIGSGQDRISFRLGIELTAEVANAKMALSVADAQGLVVFTQGREFSRMGAGKFVLILELPFFPVRPGQYIVTCMISEGDHPLAFLRTTPELTVLEGPNVKDSGYHGVLNMPAKLSICQEQDP